MYINDTCKMNTYYFADEYVLLQKAWFNLLTLTHFGMARWMQNNGLSMDVY